MKKYLIGTILVLAALAACNKEVDTPTPVVDNGQEEATPGKVTLTFTAAISDETRTAYDDADYPDQKARWETGDAISVCVTDGHGNYEVDTFTTNDKTTFSGQVTSGFTTIVSGIYPANDIYEGNSMSTYFKVAGNDKDGSVIRINLPDAYTIGSYDNGSNLANSLAFTSADNDTGYAIPMVGKIESNAFTFHHICGALKIEIVDIFNTLTFTTAGQTITGDFELNNNHISIGSQNQSSSTVTFYYGRLSGNPANGERGNRTFYIPVPYGTLSSGAIMAIKNANNVSVFEKTASNNNHGITFNSNVIKIFPALHLNLRNDWSISPDLTGANPKIHFNVTNQTDKYLRLSTTDANLESNFSGSVIEFIEKRINSGSNSTQTGSTTYTFSNTDHEKYYDDGPNKVYIMVNVDSNSKDDRKFNLDYQINRFTVPDPATPSYLAWLGKWSVNNGNNTDNWTITRKGTNKTYTVTGLCGNSSNPKKAEALFNNGNLKFMSQYDFATVKYNNDENTYYISLVGYNQNTNTTIFNSYNPYDLMEASLVSNDTANLVGAEYTYNNITFNFSKYNLLRRASHNASIYNYGTARSLPATMTRVNQ